MLSIAGISLRLHKGNNSIELLLILFRLYVGIIIVDADSAAKTRANLPQYRRRRSERGRRRHPNPRRRQVLLDSASDRLEERHVRPTRHHRLLRQPSRPESPSTGRCLRF